MTTQKKKFSNPKEEIQHLIDELNGLGGAQDGNSLYNRYAAANSRIIEMQQQENNFELRLTPEEKKFLEYAYSVAKGVQRERTQGRRFERTEGKAIVDRRSRDLTDKENNDFEQIKRAIAVMGADGQSRQRTANMIVNFGKVFGKSDENLHHEHPAKLALWAEYTKREIEVTVPEYLQLIDQLENEENPVKNQVKQLKYLTEKVMPNIMVHGAKYGVDTNEAFRVYQSNKDKAEQIVDDFASKHGQVEDERSA